MSSSETSLIMHMLLGGWLPRINHAPSAACSSPADLILEGRKIEPQLQVVWPLPHCDIEVARAAHHVLLCTLRCLILLFLASLIGLPDPTALPVTCLTSKGILSRRKAECLWCIVIGTCITLWEGSIVYHMASEDTAGEIRVVMLLPDDCSADTSREILDSCPNLDWLTLDWGSLRWWMRQRLRRPSRSRRTTFAMK